MVIEEQDGIAEQARAWVVRLASGGMTQGEHAALRAWLGESEAHARAFEAERTFWQRLGPLRDTFERLEETEAPPRPPRRFSRSAAAAAALFALAACLLLVFAPQFAILLKADHVNGGEAVQVLTLPDGSRLTLDRNSAVRVAYGEIRRSVELLQGEVFVEVVPDPARPFRLQAAGGASEALGTAYAVRLEDTAVRVAVTEGKVGVRALEAPGETREVGAGQGLRHDASGRLGNVYAIDRVQTLAWRQDRVVLVDRSLDEALAELDRYQPGRILLMNGGRGSVPVTGVIDLNRLDEGLAALAATHGLSVHRLTPFLTVLR